MINMAIVFQNGQMQFSDDVFAESGFNPNQQAPQLFSGNSPIEKSQMPPQQSPNANLNLPQYQPPKSDYIDSQINPMATDFHGTLLNFKKQYADAENEKNFYNNHLLNNKSLSDGDRQELQTRIDLLQNHQNALANAADVTRNTAHSIGIDTTGFNADNTLAESQQLMQMNNARALQGLMNLKSVREQQGDYYNEMRRRGLSPRLAQMAAEQQHDNFRENNVNQLTNGMLSYGFNSDGSMNQFGMAMLGKLANENPAMAQLFSNGFALPESAYREGNANYRQNVQSDFQREQQDRNFRNDLMKLEALQKFDWNMQKDRQKHDTDMHILQNALKSMGVPQNAMETKIKEIADMYCGGDVKKAAELYAIQNFPNWFKVDKENGNIKITDKEKVANYTSNRLKFIEYFLNKGDYQQAKEFIRQYRDNLESADFKYAEQLDENSLMYIINTLDLYDKVAAGEITLEEMRKLQQGASGDSIGSLQKLNNEDKFANAKTAELGRQKAQENKQQKIGDNANQEQHEIVLFRVPNYTGQAAYINPNPQQSGLFATPFIYKGGGGYPWYPIDVDTTRH